MELLLQCELYHWVDLLDRFDQILNEAARQTDETQKLGDGEEATSCVFLCPKLEDPNVSPRLRLCVCLIDIFSVQYKDKVVTVLNFTALLIEHSYARHIYNSTEVDGSGVL